MVVGFSVWSIMVGDRQLSDSGSVCAVRERSRNERGSIVPLLAVIMLLVLMMGSLIGVTARQNRRAATAQWAADAAALAVAAEGTGPVGRAAAADLAAANDAVLISVTADPSGTGFDGDLVSVTVVVEVEHRGVTAFSAAARVISR